MSGQKFSEYLLEKYAEDFKVATNHPFLQQAGEGTIDAQPLREWLKQDYLYAFVGYIKFASSLLSKLPLASAPEQPNIARAVEVLTFSLSNVKRETDFFLSTAAEHGLAVFDSKFQSHAASGLLGEYKEVTRGYVDFLHAIGGLGSIEEGFTLLWAMEKAYFTAWSNAKTHLRPIENPTETQKALAKFIDNWTNEEFKEFVDGCEEIMDAAEIEVGSQTGKACEEVFKRTLWLEQRFWPEVN
ncbi:hypothetical protein I316_03627 [Kwoniella heveanensis BCC8398]|uniref:Thiaminase-2/PQQC domain-containing protein n=1 Tax=Kwoniella heveanensis BCC8398 TaxID=1296120 RepID=A0A1B9GU94_9TREE|nr:hypothetical protein I316_03627 [Kwoniella heveanensis BCC8398]